MSEPRGARIGYLGPEGTVSHAALAAFVERSRLAVDQVGMPMPTLRETVLAVQDGRLDRALVPIENSREGPVNPVWDTLALEAPDVHLLAEHVQPVSYCLAVANGGGEAAIDAIRTVHSHPQATAQCADWLVRHLPGAAVVAAASTADAVRSVAGSEDPAVGAIGLRFAAERYGARIVAEGLEDEPGNATRFALIGREPAEAPAATGGPGGGERTVLVFWGERDDSAGWLVGCLQPFAERGINLTRIVSRPLRRHMGHYMFFLECDGRADTEPVAGALAELRARAEAIRVLGSYELTV